MEEKLGRSPPGAGLLAGQGCADVVEGEMDGPLVDFGASVSAAVAHDESGTIWRSLPQIVRSLQYAWVPQMREGLGGGFPG